MKSTKSALSAYRSGRIGALVALVGTLFSGPLSLLVVSKVAPQPAWVSTQVFVENFHLIQTLPFYFGFFLIGGTLVMMAAMVTLSDHKVPLMTAGFFTTAGATLILFNYFTQATFVPALVGEYKAVNEAILSAVTMANPKSLAWAIEMWGYGFLGLGTWFAAPFFASGRAEKTAKNLFILNGILSMVGALWTSYDLGWVLSDPGLVSYAAWNGLYVLMMVMVMVVFRRREQNTPLSLTPNYEAH